ncbi:MAG: SurA N-terminal domain-containing protein [Paracoccaceae bacterium]
MKSKLNKFFAWIIVLLLVLGLVGFGLQDVLSRWGTSKLATVGDIEISTKEFGQSFIREVNYISQNLGKIVTIEEAKSIGIHLRVLEKLINRSLLDKLLKDLKISIGDESLLKRIKSNTNFQDANGDFNRDNYKNYIQKLNLSENEFENILRNDLSRELLTQVFDINLNHNKNSIKLIADFIGEERKVSFYKLNTDKSNFNIKFEEKDLKNFYETNKKKYLSKTIRKFSVLNLNQSTFLNESSITNDEIEKIYSERNQEFSQPEVRELNRIVFPTQNLADRAFDDILNNKKTFAEIGKDLNLNKKSLNFGIFTKDQLEKKLSDLVFDQSNKINKVIGPINGELGFELYEIVKITPASNLSPDKAKVIIKNEIKFENSLNKLAEIIPDIEDKIASGETLEEISNQFELSIDKFEIKNDEELPKKYNNNNLESFFNNANYENSDLLQIDANSFISIRLDEEIEPKIPSYDQIYDILLYDYKKSEKVRFFEESINQLFTKYDLSDAVKLNKIVHLYDEKITRQPDNLTFLKKSTIDNIFQNSVGDFVIEKIVDTSTPYIILIKTQDIIPANFKPGYEDILNNLQNQINEQFNNDIIISLINDLRIKYKPEVNYKLLDQIIENIK